MKEKKVFITGANGYIGGSVARKLLGAGCDVRGLVRKREQAGRLSQLGIEPVLGDLENIRNLERGALWADVVVNAANYEDLASTAIFLNTLKNTGKTYVHVSGSSIAGVVTMGGGDPTVYTEQTIQPRLEKSALAAIHGACQKATQDGVRAIVVVPSIVYGESLLEVSPFFKAWAGWAQELGAVPYLGEGKNVWSNVHQDDLADLFSLAIQKAPAGSVYFAENGCATMKDMAILLSFRLCLDSQPISLPVEAFISRWGLSTTCTVFGGASLVSAEKARKELGWAPNGISLEDILGIESVKVV